jgi:hypothetical protein
MVMKLIQFYKAHGLKMIISMEQVGKVLLQINKQHKTFLSMSRTYKDMEVVG